MMMPYFVFKRWSKASFGMVGGTTCGRTDLLVAVSYFVFIHLQSSYQFGVIAKAKRTTRHIEVTVNDLWKQRSKDLNCGV